MFNSTEEILSLLYLVVCNLNSWAFYLTLPFRVHPHPTTPALSGRILPSTAVQHPQASPAVSGGHSLVIRSNQ